MEAFASAHGQEEAVHPATSCQCLGTSQNFPPCPVMPYRHKQNRAVSNGRMLRSAQTHALEGSIAQNDLVPDSHQGVQAGEDKDESAGIFVKFGD